MANNKAFKVKNGLELEAYSKSINDTAVDVFVYDTSKDSDGGAWRHRCQHTSWYNETLNTATRGSRREFPAVAVIVAESDTVKIYDGDDPDLPIWMVFNGGGSTETDCRLLHINASNKEATACWALNGVLCVSAEITGVTQINLISDKSIRSRSSGTYIFSGNISERNDTLGGADDGSLNIVNSSVNDVAMTILPTAPIDAATGLAVPTIAAATAGGISVIKDDGTVVDITFSSYGVCSYIDFTNEDKIVFTSDSTNTGNRMFKVYDIPSSDLSEGAGYDDNNALEAYQAYVTGTSQDLTFFSKNPTYGRAIAGRNFGTTNGLAKVSENTATPSSGLVSLITSDYNTGWMPGDIKLATLSDKYDSNNPSVTGSELVTNGDFGSDTSGWTAYNSVISWDSNGYLVVDDTANAGTDSAGYQDITTEVGKTYVLSFDKISTTSAFWFAIGTTAAYQSIYYSNSLGTTTGPHSHTFVATSTTTRISMISSGTGITKYDNISVRIAEPDRSVNGNGLQVIGTITKSAVATDADLVAYSGFSSSNYLQQPYNSDLDFGTGDFAYTMWFKKPNATEGVLFHRSASENSDGNWNTSGAITQVEFNGTYLQMGIYTQAFATGTTFQIVDDPYINNTWTHLVFLRTGGTTQLYINGVLIGSAANTNTTTNTSAKLWVGNRPTFGNRPFNGSIALFRISATAPSAEQIAKIYADERVLFTDNSACCLYGTSDAVTALAYDDSGGGLLHVGTSSGRSVFQGLRRVDNTTSAVGAAISASNGLVAED